MAISVPLNGNTLILFVFKTEFSYAQSLMGSLGFIEGEPLPDDKWIKVEEIRRVHCSDQSVAEAWVRSRRNLKCIRNFKITDVSEERTQIDAVIKVDY